jgi:hypothetical protein
VQPVKVQKIAPGGAVSVALAGKIPQGVTILSNRDGAVLSGVTLTGSSYSARMTIGAAEGPGFVNLVAFTPVSYAMTAVPVVFIDAVYQFELKHASGLTIKVFPTEKSFAIANDKNAELNYQADFYKAGEAKPFETRIGRMRYGASDDPRLRLDIPLWERPSAAKQELEEANARAADPKLTNAERQAAALRAAKAQQTMMTEMMKADPVATARKADDFGCRGIQVYPSADAVKAAVACGRNFFGGSVQTTGTMTLVK